MPPFSKTINIADIIPKNFTQGSGMTQPVKFLTNETPLCVFSSQSLSRAKNWQSHGRQWRVKPDQGHQKLRFDTEF